MSNASHTIFVKHGDQNTSYQVEGDTTVAKLKAMIAAKEGLLAEEMELVWSGKRLEDKATINESDLQNNTAVTLVLKVQNKPPPQPGTVQIFIKTPQNTTHTLDVSPTTKIRDVRTMIHDKTGTEPEFQRLFFGGKTLEDERDGKEMTLGDYDIHKGGSTVHIVLRLKGGRD